MKKIKNRLIEKTLATIIEFLEFLMISCIGYFLFNIEIKNIIIILLTFFISRFAIGKAGHYKIVSYFDKGWRQCLLWTTSLSLSMFLASKIDLIVGILFTIFTVFIISGNANIEDMSLGYKKKGETKYNDIKEFIKYNSFSKELLEFEETLRRKDNLLYLIYKYRFKDDLTFREISEKLNGIENVRIVEKLDQIALAIRIHCGI